MTGLWEAYCRPIGGLWRAFGSRLGEATVRHIRHSRTKAELVPEGAHWLQSGASEPAGNNIKT